MGVNKGNLTGRIVNYLSDKKISKKKINNNNDFFNGNSFLKNNFYKSFVKKITPRNTAISRGDIQNNFIMRRKKSSLKYFNKDKEELSFIVESQEKRIKELRSDLEVSEQKITELTSQKYVMMTKLSELQEIKRKKSVCHNDVEEKKDKFLDERKIKFFIDKLNEANLLVENLAKENNFLKEENEKLKEELEKVIGEVLDFKIEMSRNDNKKNIVKENDQNQGKKSLKDFTVNCDILTEMPDNKYKTLQDVIKNQRSHIVKLEGINKNLIMEKNNLIDSGRNRSLSRKGHSSKRKTLHLDSIGDTEEEVKLLKKKYKKVKKELKMLRKEGTPSSITKLALWEKEKELENAKKAFKELQSKVFELLEENDRINTELEMCRKSFK